MALRAWMLLMLALCVDANVTHAQRAEPGGLRVFLRVHDERDAELLARLRGQTSDLAVTLERMDRPLPPAQSEGAQAALALCAELGADALIWAEWSELREAGAWIALATCADRRLLARQVTLEAGTDATNGSGLSEACALVLRGALSVLRQGDSVGVQVATQDQGDPRSTPAAASVLTPAEQAPSVSDQSAPSLPSASSGRSPSPAHARRAPAPRAELQVAAGLAVQETWDGASARGQPSLQASLALGSRTHQAALTGSFGIPVALRDPYAQVNLWRHGVAIGWRAIPWRRGPWRLRVGIDLGALLYHRSVQALSSQTHPRDSKLAFAPVLSGSLEGQRALGPVWLSLGAGVDVVPRVPRFVYQTEDEQRDVLRLWPLAPRLALALVWESP